jgi:hypothetical protein
MIANAGCAWQRERSAEPKRAARIGYDAERGDEEGACGSKNGSS